ncbi:hypothetical protein GWD52_16910 [Enterobacteriaceae bacterium 4M9]|nr:hypothetical protein [Enterobacteriaceae bacterium 4M9]
MKHSFLLRLATVTVLVAILLTGIILMLEGYFAGQPQTVETGELFIMGATIITVAWSGWESLRDYSDKWDANESLSRSRREEDE